MLVLSRKVGERIVIDDHTVIEVLSVKGDRVRLGIQAPPEVHIVREELLTTRTDGAHARGLAGAT
jgi:carbon storage regulator